MLVQPETWRLNLIIDTPQVVMQPSVVDVFLKMEHFRIMTTYIQAKRLPKKKPGPSGFHISSKYARPAVTSIDKILKIMLNHQRQRPIYQEGLSVSLQ